MLLPKNRLEKKLQSIPSNKSHCKTQTVCTESCSTVVYFIIYLYPNSCHIGPILVHLGTWFVPLLLDHRAQLGGIQEGSIPADRLSPWSVPEALQYPQLVFIAKSQITECFCTPLMPSQTTWWNTFKIFTVSLKCTFFVHN